MKFFRRFPVIGSLPDMPWKAHREALVETFITIIFAAFPIILPPLLGFVILNLNSEEYIKRLLGEGELLLYAAAFVGPFVYSIFKSRPVEDDRIVTRRRISVEFPKGFSIVVTSIIICTVASLFFGVVRLSPPDSKIEVSQIAMLKISGIIYLLSVLCFYSSTVYRNDLDDASSIVTKFRTEQDRFSDEWIKNNEQ